MYQIDYVEPRQIGMCPGGYYEGFFPFCREEGVVGLEGGDFTGGNMRTLLLLPSFCRHI